jgi:hypothetical protein
MDKPEYCPTQQGTFMGYKAEFRMSRHGVSSDWKPVMTKDVLPPKGIPYPKLGGGILSTINLNGYHQALALGYCFAASCEADGHEGIEIRIVDYEINYDIKAKRLSEFDGE